MTKLLYLENFEKLEGLAKVLDLQKNGEQDVIILDETIFYPQGGGQPYDQGIIESSSGKFLVEEVRFADGVVQHIGKFEHGSFSAGDTVTCKVDSGRRKLHARIHSAGHIVDKAIEELGLGWKPGKGYHFPNGPYDEYEGNLEGLDREKVRSDIEQLCNKYISEGGKTEVLFMSREEMARVCHYVPDFSEEKGKLARIVVHRGFYMPCGGTPVADLSEIRSMMIRKIKQEGKNIKVSYDVGK
jgi:Ser-tRNA(Ala) deacylase AlaX